MTGRTNARKRVESSDRDEPSFGSRSATSSIRFVRQNVERESERRVAPRADERREYKCRVTARRFVRISVRLSRLRALPKRGGNPVSEPWRSARTLPSYAPLGGPSYRWTTRRSHSLAPVPDIFPSNRPIRFYSLADRCL